MNAPVHDNFSAETEIVYWHTARQPDGQIHGQGRKVALSLELTHDILFRLLVTPSRDMSIQKRVADFHVALCFTRFDDVLKYLRDFFEHVLSTCDVGTPDLKVLTRESGLEFDFPRSSASWMMMSQFCKSLQNHEGLGHQLKPLLSRWK